MTALLLPLALALRLAAVATTPYEVDPLADGAATLGSFALVAIAEAAVKPTLAAGAACRKTLPDGRCDPSDLVWPDRTMVSNDSRAWATVSDIGAGLSYGLPLVLEGIDVWMSDSSTPLADFGTDVLVMAESVAAATLLTTSLKFAVRRPRPAQYRSDASGGSVERQLSFPSGHTSSASAAATSYAMTFWLRHPESPWRFVVVAGATAIVGLTGYGRVGGGWHFYTDVAAGAAVGVGMGLLIPALHKRDLQIAFAPEPGGGASVALTMGY